MSRSARNPVHRRLEQPLVTPPAHAAGDMPHTGRLGAAHPVIQASD